MNAVIGEDISDVGAIAGTEDRTARLARNTAIITFGVDSWWDSWLSRQQIMSRLGTRGWKVVYTTGAISVWDIGKDSWTSARWRGGFQHTDGVLVDRPGRAIPRWPSSRLWDRFAIRHQTRRLIQTAGWKSAQVRIAYLFHPRFWPYVEYLGDCHIVYHLHDAFAQTPGWNRKLDQAQQELSARADLLLTGGQRMTETLPEETHGKARTFPGAADAAAFMAGERAACPADLAAIPRPRIGYIGAINLKVDVNLIADTAARRPDWHWVVVGQHVGQRAAQADSAWQDGLKRCQASPNVHFLGLKHHSDLPAYANHIDVNTMCYRVDGSGWWRAIYPLKLHEYLATGNPVVSADLETVRPFAPVVDIAHNTDDWIAAIDRALAGSGVGTKETRRATALENTWERRIDQLERWFVELAGEKTG